MTHDVRRMPRRLGLAGSPAERVAAFVQKARLSARFGFDLAFDDRQWDVSAYARQKSGVPTRTGRLMITFEATGAAEESEAPDEGSQRNCGGTPLSEVIRAIVRLMRNPGHHQMIMVALSGRLVSQAMANFGITATSLLTPIAFEQAWRLAKLGHKASYAAKLGSSLEALSRFLDDNLMTNQPLGDWHRGNEDDSDEGDQDSSGDGLPSAETLDMLQKAHRLATYSADVVVTRITLLLLAAPERFCELRAVGAQPEVALRSGTGRDALALRWPGCKLHPDGLKIIPGSIESQVREALEDLRRETNEGRRMKAHYDLRPTDLYLRPDLERVRGSDRLSPADLGALLGIDDRRLGAYVRDVGIPLLPRRHPTEGASNRVSFAALERHVLAVLPARMRDAGGRGTDILLIVPDGTFRRRTGKPSSCMFEVVTHSRVRAMLTPRPEHKTVFQHLGLDPEGRIGIRTHDFRRYISTLAKRGGVNDTDLAMWSGRVNTGSNRRYDLRSPSERSDAARRRAPKSRRETGPLARGAKGKER